MPMTYAADDQVALVWRDGALIEASANRGTPGAPGRAGRRRCDRARDLRATARLSLKPAPPSWKTTLMPTSMANDRVALPPYTRVEGRITSHGLRGNGGCRPLQATTQPRRGTARRTGCIYSPTSALVMMWIRIRRLFGRPAGANTAWWRQINALAGATGERASHPCRARGLRLHGRVDGPRRLGPHPRPLRTGPPSPRPVTRMTGGQNGTCRG